MRTAHNRKDLVGQSFAFLTVIASAGSRGGRAYWRCRCRCGNETEVPSGNLTRGNTKSCGCHKGSPAFRAAISASKTRHGHNMRNSRTYVSWQAMKRRCEGRKGYADKGIAYDPRWESFENFLADMGERPQHCSLDRIDNDGPYSSQNCRWASQITQGNNRGNNRWITYEGRTQTVAEWAREIGVSRGVLYNRIMLLGWTLERAMKP